VHLTITVHHQVNRHFLITLYNRRTLKATLVQNYYRPIRFQKVEAPRFLNSQHIKVIRLSALRTSRLYSPGNIPGTHFCYRLSRFYGHSAAGRMSIKNSNGTIGNRTRDLPACSTMPESTTLPRAPTGLYPVKN